MVRALSILFAAASLSMVAAGCSPPVARILYTLPTDIPVVGEARVIEVGIFAPSSGTDKAVGKLAAEVLWRAIARTGRFQVLAEGERPKTGTAQVAVGGTVHLVTRDTASKRRVKRLDPKTRKSEFHEVPTLVREVALRVDFVFTDARSGRRLGGVETHQAYNSLSDPRVRGELGLERGDDPSRVPSVDQVVGELLDACVETFMGIIEPVEIEARVPLRRTLNAEGLKGLKRFKVGEFAKAARHFALAAAEKPDDADTLFNLAVAEECAGLLEKALGHYEEVLKRKGPSDADARDAALRLKRVLGRKAGKSE